MAEYDLEVRVAIQAPPPGVAWALQVGRDVLLPPVGRAGGLEFGTTLRIVAKPDGTLDFRGSVVQGPRNGRFLYLNSGVRAGQVGSCWDRRAKVSLEGLRPLLSGLDASSCAVRAVIEGTGKDGGPACASVPLKDPGWQAAPRVNSR